MRIVSEAPTRRVRRDDTDGRGGALNDMGFDSRLRERDRRKGGATDPRKPSDFAMGRGRTARANPRECLPGRNGSMEARIGRRHGNDVLYNPARGIGFRCGRTYFLAPVPARFGLEGERSTPRACRSKDFSRFQPCAVRREVLRNWRGHGRMNTACRAEGRELLPESVALKKDSVPWCRPGESSSVFVR